MHRLIAFVVLVSPATAAAGLHYSAEESAELPAQWRGFLADHRALRFIGVAPAPGVPAHELRDQYDAAAKTLEAAAKVRVLTADEVADLGALYVRLGRPTKAIEVLRGGRRDHPNHFAIAANLGTAWQAQGDLVEAIRALGEAVHLAPARWKPAEELHLKLVTLRQAEGKTTAALDDLFGVNFADAIDRKKLPAADVALVQQLALWLPGDARILWQLSELANAHGDARTAAAIMEGCVSEYGLTAPDVRARRKVFRSTADAIAKLPNADHANYKGNIAFKSPRALARKLDASTLPAIRADGMNPLPWSVVAETVIDKPFRPKFLKHLELLDGKSVSITGFMQPVTTDLEVAGFMLVEYPIGCWFCETPEPTGLLYVDLAGGRAVPVKRGRVKVEGTLKLNKGDPEDFLYTLTGAKVRDPD